MKYFAFFFVMALLLSVTTADARVDPIDQTVLGSMTEQQLMSDFDATIQEARQMQNDFIKSRGRRTALSMVPLVGAGVAVGTAGKVGDMQAYKCRLLQLKREMRARFPAAWETTKKKWGIDDHYLE
jgi:hypothetical protein